MDIKNTKEGKIIKEFCGFDPEGDSSVAEACLSYCYFHPEPVARREDSLKRFLFQLFVRETK